MGLLAGSLGGLGLGGRSGDVGVGILSDVAETSVVDQRLGSTVGGSVGSLGGVGLSGSLGDLLGGHILLGSLGGGLASAGTSSCGLSHLVKLSANSDGLQLNVSEIFNLNFNWLIFCERLI